MKLFVRNDIEGDQAYIGFGSAHEQKRGVVKKTVRVTEDIFVDLDGEGRLMGIDILNASRVMKE